MPNSFKRASDSLVIGAFMAVQQQINGDEHRWFTGEHFHHDPNPDEIVLHQVRSGATNRVIKVFKEQHPERVLVLPE